MSRMWLKSNTIRDSQVFTWYCFLGSQTPYYRHQNQAEGVPRNLGIHPVAAALPPLEVLMRSPSVLSAAALCLASACSDSIPVEPTTAALSAFSARASVADEQFTATNSAISNIPAEFGVPSGDFVVASAELLYDIDALKGASPTLI